MKKSRLSRFGELLRKYREQCNKRGISQTQLARAISRKLKREYSRNAVSLWELGKSRIDQDDRDLLVCLITVLRDCGGLSKVEEADELLEAGNYRPLSPNEISKISDEWVTQDLDLRRILEHGQGRALEPQSAKAIRSEGTVWPPTIPDDPYYSLPGREENLNILRDTLLRSDGPRTLVISGLGGLGKTSLAVELAHRLLDTKTFRGIVGDSAKQELLLGEEIVQIRNASLGFETLMEAMIRQLQLWSLSTLKPEEIYYALSRFFNTHPYLILIDNLETSENVFSLVYKLQGFVGRSKAILTSRKQIIHQNIKSTTLHELSRDDSFEFIKREAAEREIEQIKNTTRENLSRIYELAGGAPLAMKLITRQAVVLDLSVILSRLTNAGSNLYRFIYQQSWDQLSEIARGLLVYIGKTVVTTVGWEELRGINLEGNDADLAEAIEQLVSFSLLNVHYTHNETRYGVHQLTRNFVNTDLPQIWKTNNT